MNKPLQIHEIWVYLSGSPLLALILTLSAYQIGFTVYQKTNRSPLANPVAIAVILVASALELIGMPYAKYFQGAQFVHFLLGTATVALAIPIYRGFRGLRGRVIPLLIALLCGATTSIASAVWVARYMGASDDIVGALIAKSVTAPIAMGVAERIHTSPTLTAVFAVITGILGAVFARYVFDFMGMRVWWQRGFAIGLAAHGIGTSRAFSVHPEAGTYASLAMGLHGILGAVVIPLIASYIPY
ncbi:MAG: murein hydrolase effector protein LrgB [Ferrovum sp. 37-45-19]|uniref:LrgB family protein n=1 Tax=Ferrovum sp. JA12 TaxID=1356299 RepID=UPI000702D56F|nr:LrgB family protein [Ferrovum sp. JA12]OYV79750.1 MAG: murein hydrolase effector protein LrgB [Ferrovum sp. 21-44-67]OYV95372.1 MAG: murein hydrolase effector protein LrgB [Ferrovum sp. 37-45-19]OZB31431.1 MAG: murein hydrolase effector protein LrgB [Ferrovum sp. 34-44-207]HQT81163.1 LrgB family protein [Ferrovaceae bacterium]KRH78049.1 inner membrane protein YohK [Ferrovum sp. JA12]